MRKFVLLVFVVLSSSCFATDNAATCKLDDKSIIGHSADGTPQVSNMGPIDVSCTVSPGRPFPTQPGEVQYALRVTTLALALGSDGSSKVVVSTADPIGSERSGESETVHFYIHIPLDTEELRAEIRRFVDNLEEVTASMPMSERDRQLSDARFKQLRTNPDELANIVNQHRVGHCKIECQIKDREELKGVGKIEFEVLYKGRFSDGPLHLQDYPKTSENP